MKNLKDNKKCQKCETLYDTLMAVLDEQIKYFTNREKYRDRPKDEEWSEERKKAYNENRINAFRIRKEFITKFYKEEE